MLDSDEHAGRSILRVPADWLNLPQRVDTHDLHILFIGDLGSQASESFERVHAVVIPGLSSDLGDTGVGKEEVEVTFLLQRLGYEGRNGLGGRSVGFDRRELYGQPVLVIVQSLTCLGRRKVFPQLLSQRLQVSIVKVEQVQSLCTFTGHDLRRGGLESV